MGGWLLDTDHVTLLERGHPPLQERLVAISPDSIAVSVVTMEESIRGRLAVLARRSAGERRVRAYSRFIATVQLFGTIRVLPFTMACEELFQELRSSRLRVGSQDLRIAATALVHEMRVVTRNRKDFGRVPGLALEDWSVG